MARGRAQLAAVMASLRQAGKFGRRVVTPRKTGRALERVQRIADISGRRTRHNIALTRDLDKYAVMGDLRAKNISAKQASETISDIGKHADWRVRDLGEQAGRQQAQRAAYAKTLRTTRQAVGGGLVGFGAAGVGARVGVQEYRKRKRS